MKTEVLVVDPLCPDPGAIKLAAEVIRSGGLVAFPTETVYGLGANAFDENAVRRVFEAKGRPTNNPLPIQVASEDQIGPLVREIPESAIRLMREFLPGPLTIVFHASPGISDLITAGTGKIGIRVPDHPVALELIRAAGVPIVAPSANISGQPAPTTAAEVLSYLNGRVEIILDSGSARLRSASTVVDITEDPVRILRHGTISDRQVAQALAC